MRFSRSHRARHNGDESILPLTNVVFLLLIFFMLAGQITGPQPFEIDPPESSSETNADSNGIEVEIAGSGELALDRKPISLDQLANAVAQKLAAHPSTPLRLKADGGGDATRVVAVMHVLHDAGAEKLRLITIVPSNG